MIYNISKKVLITILLNNSYENTIISMDNIYVNVLHAANLEMVTVTEEANVRNIDYLNANFSLGIST